MSRTNNEKGVATQAAREVIEQLRSVEFREAFARFNANPADDPPGPGRAPGSRFEVAGLDPLPQDADRLVGAILFPIKSKSAMVLARREPGSASGSSRRPAWRRAVSRQVVRSSESSS